MEKSNYKLFFHLGDKPVNINLKHVLNPQMTQPNETRSKLFNQDIQKNIYTKAKRNYEFLIKKNNKNIFMLNKKGGKFPSKEYLEAFDNLDKKLKKDNFSLSSFPPHKKENNKSVEELRRMQRNKVTMRRIEYSMKVKHTTNKKRNKYNIKKVITIQKWVRGFLIRNLFSNISYFEDFTNKFIEHIKKFVFLKHKKIMSDIIHYLQYKQNKISINENKGYNSIKNLGESDNNRKRFTSDIINENSNERYIDDDSIMEYNNRYSNENKKEINNINNNILFFSSKDFDKIISSPKNNIFNSNSNILFNSGNSKIKINNNNSLNSINNTKPKEDTLNSIKEESLISSLNVINNNIIINNVKTESNENINFDNDLFIRKPKLNRKFMEEINNTHTSATPTKYNIFFNNNDTKTNHKNDILNNINKKNINFIKASNNQINSIINQTNNIFNSNKKSISEENSNNQKEIYMIKPICSPCHINKIRICKKKLKIKFEKIDLKFSKSEKKYVPKMFDLNYQYSEDNQSKINLNDEIQNNQNQNQDDTLKNIIINSHNDSSDMNINVLKVVNNNIDELNNSIKNIVKEEVPSSSLDMTQNKQNNIFTKSLRELLKLDQQKTNNDLIIEEKIADDNLDNSANIQSKEMENKISIEAIKEEKEEYEDEKENDTTCKNNDFIKCENNINFCIIPQKKYDKRKIILVYMFEKQIKYNVKPYIFNILKRFWINKLKNK